MAWPVHSSLLLTSQLVFWWLTRSDSTTPEGPSLPAALTSGITCAARLEHVSWPGCRSFPVPDFSSVRSEEMGGEPSRALTLACYIPSFPKMRETVQCNLRAAATWERAEVERWTDRKWHHRGLRLQGVCVGVKWSQYILTLMLKKSRQLRWWEV